MLLAPLIGFATMMQTDYQAELSKWRKEYEAELAQPRGWLALQGLYWLKQGTSTTGSDPSNDIKLPPGAPRQFGTITLDGSRVLFNPLKARASGQEEAQILKPDSSGKPDELKFGSMTMIHIKRGNRFGLRLWDAEASARKSYKGSHWYAPDPKFVIKAKFVPYPAGKTIPITNVLGDTTPSPCVGFVEFRVGETVCRLDALEEAGGLFLIFKDQTSGKETYGAGRFLNTSAPVRGTVTLDFNKATNPPCAFTAFATCPLPPKQNVLSVAILAGEKKFHD